MEKRMYEIEERAATLAQIEAEGKTYVADNIIDLDENGRPTNCYFMVVDAPPPEPDLLAEADEYILELEYQNLLLKEELADAANL